MSQEQTLTLTVDEIKELVKNASPTERKYLLELKLQKRTRGCGYVYLFHDTLDVVYGDAEVLELSKSFDNCLDEREVLVIPKTVPVIVVVEHHDEDPSVRESTDIYIFDREGWKKTTVYH